MQQDQTETPRNMSEQLILKAFVVSDFGRNPFDRKSIYMDIQLNFLIM